MKRTITIAALAAFAAAGCASPAPSPGGNSSPPTANAAANSPAPTPAEVSDADIIARERQLWDTIKRKDYDAFAGQLADDQLYVTGDGVYDKAATLKGIREFELSELALADFKVVRVDKDAAVVTYTSTAKGKSHGKEFPQTTMRESTAWVNRGGKWLAAYHQDAEVAEPPAAPGGAQGNANSAAAPAASPAHAAASPAPTANDPLGKEKEMWEALKRKDYDAFANNLTEDAVEVEPNGVFDKKRSIEGVKDVDFSGVTLGDFKEVKLDHDASLVTYLARSKGKGWNPAGERHSTVWVNRGGRWQAAFHQGTYVKK